jgi:hypothetical protein
VAISGQSGQVSPLAGVDMDRIRDAIETARAQGGIAGWGDGIFAGGLAAAEVLAAGVWRRDLAEADLAVEGLVAVVGRTGATFRGFNPGSRMGPSSGSAATRR